MKVIKKYTAISIDEKRVNRDVEPTFEYGRVDGPYYNETSPETRFDTEEEAIKWAYKNCKHKDYLIVPVISFDIWEDE